MNPDLHQHGVRKLVAAGFAAVCLALSACDSALLTCDTDCPEPPESTDSTDPTEPTEPTEPTASNNLIETATEAGDFTTLLSAIEAASLQDVLADPDSEFTVFAPTDAAFAVLGEDAVTALLADNEALNDTLLYHVLPGSIDAATAIGLAGTEITMQNGETAMLSLAEDGSLMINDATVTTTDIVASNGIIHVIDAVLTPPTESVPVNIVQTAAAAGTFTTLVAALEASGLDQVLANEAQNFTVFAPTDDAFTALGQDAVDALLADAAGLNDTLLYHVLPGAVDAETAISLAGTSITMQNGADAMLSLSGEQLMINSSNVTVTDIIASNGIIHVIDAVLIPPDGTEPPASDLIATLANMPNYSALLSALQSTGLDATLADSTKTFTVFAPDNAAFAAAETALEAGFTTNAAALMSLLEGHVLPDSVVDAATALTLDGTEITMANGAIRTITVADGAVLLDEATVIEADIMASNGIIHGIDTVLIP